MYFRPKIHFFCKKEYLNFRAQNYLLDEESSLLEALEGFLCGVYLGDEAPKDVTVTPLLNSLVSHSCIFAHSTLKCRICLNHDLTHLTTESDEVCVALSKL